MSMNTASATSGTDPAPAMRQLARREISRYLRHPLYLVGAVLLAVLTTLSVVNPTYPASTTFDMILPAALLGVLGLVVMVSLTHGSDRAAEAAGAVATSERTRTYALAWAVVVPVSTALIWFAAAVFGYVVNPTGPGAVPFGGFSDADVLATMFALGVMSAAGGPILGLAVARWLPRRGAAAIVAVVLVLGTILMQGNFESTRTWRLAWPWTYFYGPLGWDGDSWMVLTGSPLLWIGYLGALCVLGVLVAALHDSESDRRPVVRGLGITAVFAVMLLVLSITGGLDEAQVNPLPQDAPAAGSR